MANTTEMQNNEDVLLGYEFESGVEALEGVTEETETGINMEFKGWEQFGKSFEYMGIGMLGIFIVTAILITLVTALNRLKFGKGK